MSKVIKKCLFCNQNYEALFKNRNKQKFCSRKCVNQYQTGKNNPAYGKTYCTKENNPEWAFKIKQSTKGKINLGDCNGMKKLEARTKVSVARKEMFADIKVRKHYSEKTKKAWADGKFEGVRVGQCKWYEYKKVNGETIKCQGTWELAFAKWADESGLLFETHKGRITYLDIHESSRLYYPDFYIYEWDAYVDIKNEYHFNLQKEKFECIYKSNPDINLEILRRSDLEFLGVIL